MSVLVILVEVREVVAARPFQPLHPLEGGGVTVGTSPVVVRTAAGDLW